MSQGLFQSDLPADRPAAWQDSAACSGVAREVFFAPLIKEGRWRQFCSACPVVDACFWAAMVEEEGDDSGYRFGVRGGATPSVRRKVAEVTFAGYARKRLGLALDAWRKSQAACDGAASPTADAGAEAVGF